MKKLLFVTSLVFCFLLPASAQAPKYKYEFTKFGAPFPNASGKRADTASVAADGKGLIFVLRRSDPPVLVYNREGKLVNSWGTGIFVDDHNIDVDRFGFVWIGDRNGQIGKFMEEWEPLHLTPGSGFTMDDNDTFYVGDTNGHQLITVKDGKVIDRIGGLQVEAHQATWDSGDRSIYLADTGAEGGMIWKADIKK